MSDPRTDTANRQCEGCGAAMPGRMHRQRRADGRLVGECCMGRTAAIDWSHRLAHDSGDNAILNHCPFCGAGGLVGRSDGSAECGYCKTVFTVQVQPQYSNMPQTVNGQPVEMPGMPGDEPTDMSAPVDPAVPEDKPEETTIPGAEPPPDQAPGTDPHNDPKKKQGPPPFVKQHASRTASVEWGEAEYDRMGGDGKVIQPQAADLNGISGEVFQDDEGWAWSVMPSGSRSEYPELYDAGAASSEADAKAQAERAMAKADASYGHPFRNASLRTAEGAELDEEAFVRHLAIKHAEDRDAVLAQVRAENE